MTTANSAGKIFHSNDNYSIVVNDDATGYDVVNDNSGVVEFNAESLPECIFAAENLNVVLVHRTYEWVAKRAQDQAIKDSGLKMATVTGIQ
jgi:hypothetical protein